MDSELKTAMDMPHPRHAMKLAVGWEAHRGIAYASLVQADVPPSKASGQASSTHPLGGRRRRAANVREMSHISVSAAINPCGTHRSIAVPEISGPAIAAPP